MINELFPLQTPALSLMNARLGGAKPVKSDAFQLNGLDGMADRLHQQGGFSQQDRMILDKKRSLDRALKFSYQGADVRLDGKSHIARALINPNKLKQDYDDKIISIPKEEGYQTGDIFEWLGTQTKWLIYLQDLTELAYFHGDIRKCSYEIVWEDEEGNQHSSAAAVRGPVETKINYIQKHGISVDIPNHSLNMLMPKNEYTMAYFDRYKKFYLQGDPTCWRVEATDWISTPGILEITAVEYYANETEDDIEAGIVGALIPEQEDPNSADNKILGDAFIKVRKSAKFKYDGSKAAIWEVDKNCPVVLTINADDPREVSVYWDNSYSGQFELRYGNLAKKTIVVESLF